MSRRPLRAGLLLAAMLSMLAKPVFAEDFFSTVETRAPELSVSAARTVRYKAWLQQKTGYGYRSPAVVSSRDRAALTRTETELYGQWDWRRDEWQVRLAASVVHDWLPDLAEADLWSGYSFNPQQRDKRRWRLEGADSYLSWQRGDWWIKGGYQTLAWGESETLKVTDVLARRDQRWPGQEDLEELRLPVPALVVNWRAVDAVLLPDMPLDRQAAPFDEFDPYLGLRRSATQPAINTKSGERPGWALRWQKRMPGVDMQVMFADIYSFDPEPREATLIPGPAPVLESLTLRPWRQQVVGLGLQSARGSWLLKTEQAWHQGVKLPSQDPLAPWSERNQWRAMLAAEYSGVRNLTLTGEFSWLHTASHATELLEEAWQTGQALRLRYLMFHNRLALSGLTMRLTGGEGSLLRLAADLQLSDEVSVGLSLVNYGASRDTQLLYPFRHNDTVLLTLRWGL